MDMIEKRNLSSHSYNEEIADTLAAVIISSFYPCFLSLWQRFKEEPTP